MFYFQMTIRKVKKWRILRIFNLPIEFCIMGEPCDKIANNQNRLDFYQNKRPWAKLSEPAFPPHNQSVPFISSFPKPHSPSLLA